MGKLRGGGDTQALPAVWTFLHWQVVGMQKHLTYAPYAWATKWNFHYLIFPVLAFTRS